MPLYLGRELAPTTEFDLSVRNQPTGDYLKWRGGPILAQVWDDASGTNHGLRLTPVTGKNYAWMDIDGAGGGFFHHFGATIGKRTTQRWIGICSNATTPTAALLRHSADGEALLPLIIQQDDVGGSTYEYMRFHKADNVAGTGAAIRIGSTIEFQWASASLLATPLARLYMSYNDATAKVLRLQPYGTGGNANQEVGLDLAPLGTSGISTLRLYADAGGDTDAAVAFQTAKVVVAHDTVSPGLFDAVGTTDSAVVWTQPPQSILLGAKMMLDEQFAATGLTTMDVWIGDAGDNDGLMLQTMNLRTDTVAGDGYDSKGAYWNGATGATYWTAAAKTWTAYATSGVANLNTLTAGQVTFYFFYIRLGDS